MARVDSRAASWDADGDRLRALGRLHAHGCYLGMVRAGPLFAPPEHGVLVLGPPRSGKTTGVIIPNICAGPGVVAISTKRDILDDTYAHRRKVGRCSLFDPSGTVSAPKGVHAVGWSPLPAASTWSGAVAVAESMVGAARPRAESGDGAHWTERATALLSCLLHAAALEDARLDDLLSMVNRREPERALAVLTRHDAELAADVLTGIVATDSREQSGIWSTTSGVLAAYRTATALESAARPTIGFDGIIEGDDTLYVVAPAERQRHAAPIVAGLVRELRERAYRRALLSDTRRRAAPVLLVLDELANIAPLHDLPELISEGGSQGLVTIACLQDLAQARNRWGPVADGFLSLFGCKLILGGLGDVRTLEAVSLLAGDHDVAARSSSRSGFNRRSTSVATRRLRRLAPDAVAALERGRALVIRSGQVAKLDLPPFDARALRR